MNCVRSYTGYFTTVTIPPILILTHAQEVPGLIETDPASGLEMLNQIQGHIVPMPLQFLKNEALLPPFGTKEAIAPDLFT